MTDHPIPFAALDGKFGIMGIAGSGKTFTAIGMVEQLLDAGYQTIVVDPTGVYNGLRTLFPIPIFGGKFGDLPISEDDGAAIARAIIDGNLSAIVDVSALLKKSHAAAREFMRPFVAELKNAPTSARYLVMDEADEFMPENVAGDGAPLFGDLKWIVRRGRSEGWRMMMITQRPQDIAKSVLTQCETMVIHRLTAPQDRKALVEWVKGNADSEQARAVLDSMATLATGEAWLWSPKHDLLTRVQIPPNRSEDRGKTPAADDAPRATLGFKPVDLATLRKSLAVGGEPDPVDDPAWRDQVKAEDAAARSKRSAFDDHLAQSRKIMLLEAKIERLIDEHTVEMATGQQQMNALIAENRELRRLVSVIGDAAAELRRIRPAFDHPDSTVSQTVPVPPTPVAGMAVQSAERPAGDKADVTAGETAPDALKVPPGCAKPLAALAAAYPAAMTEAQWATVAGYKRTGGTWKEYRSRLVRAGMIERADDLWRATDLGAAAAGDVELPPAAGPELARWWAKRIPGTGRLVDELIVTFPAFCSRQHIADRLGMSVGGGSFKEYVSRLRRNGLIVEASGAIRLSHDVMGSGAQ